MPRITPSPPISRRPSPYSRSASSSPVRPNPTSAEHDAAESSTSQHGRDSFGEKPLSTNDRGSKEAVTPSPTSRDTGMTAAQWSRRTKPPLSAEQEAARAATKARNAAAKADFESLKRDQKASATQQVMPGRERAIVQEGLLSNYLLNMNHYALDGEGQKRPDASHGHDKAVRFQTYGYAVVKEGMSGPDDEARKFMTLLTSQIKEVALNNPAKKTLDRNKHEEAMVQLVRAGKNPYPFPGDLYSISGTITTPSGARKVLKTGWKVPDAAISGTEIPILLSAYIK